MTQRIIWPLHVAALGESDCAAGVPPGPEQSSFLCAIRSQPSHQIWLNRYQAPGRGLRFLGSHSDEGAFEIYVLPIKAQNLARAHAGERPDGQEQPDPFGSLAQN